MASGILAGALLLFAAFEARASPRFPRPPKAQFGVKFTGEAFSGLLGGLRRGSEGNYLLDARFALNSEQLGLWRDGELYMDITHIRGAQPSSRLSGDIQVASNIAAPAATRVYEFWYAQDFADRRVRLRLGIVDLNKHFDAVPGSGQLNNSSFGVEPALSLNAPASIYPEPGWGMTAGALLGKDWHARLGLFQGQPARRSAPLSRGAMLIGELTRSSSPAEPVYMLGMWHYAQPQGGGFGNPASDWGAYAAWVTPLPDAQRRLFLQAGYSPAAASRAPYYLEAGYAWDGPFSGRPDDRLSLGLARAWVRTTTATGLQAETALEANYGFALGGHLMLAPDLQYILQPLGTGAPVPNAWVALLRLYANTD